MDGPVCTLTNCFLWSSTSSCYLFMISVMAASWIFSSAVSLSLARMSDHFSAKSSGILCSNNYSLSHYLISLFTSQLDLGTVASLFLSLASFSVCLCSSVLNFGRTLNWVFSGSAAVVVVRNLEDRHFSPVSWVGSGFSATLLRLVVLRGGAVNCTRFHLRGSQARFSASSPLSLCPFSD